ncbi:MAG: hypothetical protein CFE29_20760 [Bradyrhizobiaceae bacterium PARB1]|nr:MAG: hypothetical protein CFE29_20760 [Bradyrhizobiaceae bacterium PARB1]
MTAQASEHGISDAFLDHLDQLARQESGSWWRDVLLRDDVFLAVRRNSLNVYYRGGSIFRIDDRGDGTASPKTHVKYLVRQQQTLAELVDGEFRPNAIGWTHYAGDETLKDMIRSAGDLARAEKTGLHPMIMSSSAVIDVEIALGRIRENALAGDTADSGQPPSNRQDRLDVATLERRDQSIAVVFHEAKHFTNTALRARAKPPAVIDQLSGYRSTLAHHTSTLVARYQAVCRALVRLDAMRRHVRSDAAPESFPLLEPLVREVAGGKAVLTIDVKPRLIVFGFDGDQKKGQLQTILNTLRKSDPSLAIYAAGDPASASGAFRAPVTPKLRQKSHV